MAGTPKVWSAVFPLEPKPKLRPRLGKFGTYTPAATRAAEGELRYFLSKSNPIKFAGAVSAEMIFSFKRPKSASAKKRPHMTVKSDIDNLVKQVADSANGILWDDDAQIVEILARKIYGESSSISIVVREYEPGRILRSVEAI